MNPRFRLLLWLCLGPFWATAASALEVNYWPFFTGQQEEATGDFDRWQAFGPFVFGRHTEGASATGVRPLWVRIDDLERDRMGVHVLYPLFNYRSNPQGVSWDIFNLLRFDRFGPEEAENVRTAHLFPILFFRQDPDRPERSYFGIFPIAGTAQNQLGYTRLMWFPFPFMRLERGEVTTVAMPWPFLRFVQGPGVSGYHIWPLYGSVAHEGRFERRYWLWPLGYRVRNELWKEQPFEAFGFLPFYAQSVSETAESRSFIWPFFGYTDSRSPEYFETRYFWPFVVQRRGESYVNRWAPFYSRSVRSGVEKRWIAWPIYREESRIERDLLHEKTQVLYFLYWNLRQSDPVNEERPAAVKRHVWPFFSYWDNGADRRQVQVLNPFEVFYPQNDIMRVIYTPLFALYRFDRQDEATTRNSLIFDFVTWGRTTETSHFHVGPLVQTSAEDEGRRWEVLKGLVGYDGTAERRRVRLFWWPRPGPAEEEDQ
jgi:hypothetical protein